MADLDPELVTLTIDKEFIPSVYIRSFERYSGQQQRQHLC